MPKEQLCWTCQNACGKCSWSQLLIPVKGWIATPTIIHDSVKPYPSYRIDACPRYIPDWGTPERTNKYNRLTDAEKRLIANLYKQGMKKSDIAKKVHCSYYSVKKYCNFAPI